MLDGQETKRLYFRLLKQEDFETWLELFREEGVARLIGMGKFQHLKNNVKSGLSRLSIVIKMI